MAKPSGYQAPRVQSDQEFWVPTLPLPQAIKDAATVAFRDNGKRSQMTAREREAAAQFYEQIAHQTVGIHADLARLYNLERARFLRGQVDHIAPTAYQFGQEIRISGTDQD